MANTTYEVTLSTDGKHAIRVSSDDPDEVKAGLAWAKGLYQVLLARPGRSDDEDEPKTEEAPICAVHDVPMVLVQGRKGPFWSCHERDADGNWCTYRPKGR